jgi:hypothetical protein
MQRPVTFTNHQKANHAPILNDHGIKCDFETPIDKSTNNFAIMRVRKYPFAIGKTQIAEGFQGTHIRSIRRIFRHQFAEEIQTDFRILVLWPFTDEASMTRHGKSIMAISILKKSNCQCELRFGERTHTISNSHCGQGVPPISLPCPDDRISRAVYRMVLLN